MSEKSSRVNRTNVMATLPPMRVWLLHVGGNAALLGLAYLWLWLPDAKLWQLAASAALALFVLAAALWVHGATLAFLDSAHRGAEESLVRAFRSTLPRLPALFAWLVLVLAALWLLKRFDTLLAGWAAPTASWLTLKLQKPVHPQTIANGFATFIWVLMWFAVPLTFLPCALQVSRSGLAAFGWSRVRCVWRSFWRMRYWLGYVVVFVVGAYLPYRIAAWAPKVSGLGLEGTSAAVRFVLAYLLAICGWLALLSLVAKFADQNGIAPTSTPASTAGVPGPSPSVSLGGTRQ